MIPMSVRKGNHSAFRILVGVRKSRRTVRFTPHKAKIVGHVRYVRTASVRQVLEKQFNAHYFKKQKNET